MKFSSSDVPQANRVDLLFIVLNQAKFESCTATTAALALTAHAGSDFVPRQGAYYADACVVLGLMLRNDDGYVLTQRGKQVVASKSGHAAGKMMSSAILETPLFSELLRDLPRSDNSVPSISEIAEWVSAHTGLSLSTAVRRSSTIRNFLKYARENK